MFGSSILEVAIGVVFIYLFLSLICSAINEGIASTINKRGSNLFDGVKNLLNDPKFTGLAQQLYTHGLIDGISQEAANPAKENRLPSYMSSNTFALALLDILGSQGITQSYQETANQRQAELTEAQANLATKPDDADLQSKVSEAQAALAKANAILLKAEAVKQAHAAADTAAQQVTSRKDTARLQNAAQKLAEALSLGRSLAAEFPDQLGNIERAVTSLPAGHTKQSLLVLINKTKREASQGTDQIAAIRNQIVGLERNVEVWFNDSMDRCGGWYKRWTQKVLLVISIILVIGTNADTIMLVKRFSRDNALRASVVSAAERAVQNTAGNPAENEQAREKLLQDAESIQLPLGWVSNPNDPFKTDQIPKSFLGWLLKILGLIISIFAVSLGAPFWFDMLSKFINLRGAGTPPGETKKSAPQGTGN
ncbi:MAG: hypothetical protein H7Y30_16640 [Pyrinomonadaceae bacterium]|nr:hypothetical protein [Pyrinomonadaceae bacterium]